MATNDYSPSISCENFSPLHIDIINMRNILQNYRPPVLANAPRSDIVDPVTGDPLSPVPLLAPQANVVFFGPVGSGKSSLIGSIFRTITQDTNFPEFIHKELADPDRDVHKTLHWREYRGNNQRTILLQDTRGDQVYSEKEAQLHSQGLKGFYRDGNRLLLEDFKVFNREWWSQRFFWTSSIKYRPHCVVFVFDGSLEPFLVREAVNFFKSVFSECLAFNYEPIVVVTCLDIIYKRAMENGLDFEEEIARRRDVLLTAFSQLHLTNSRIHFLTNFNRGDRHTKLWGIEDQGFHESEYNFLKLAQGLLETADKFLRRNSYSTEGSSYCTLL